MLACLIAAPISPRFARACPFCSAVKPSLAARRDAAAVVLLGEKADSPPKAPAVSVHRVLKGETLLPASQALTVPDLVDLAQLKPGTLVLLLGQPAQQGEPPADWEVTPLDEIGYSYVLKSPDLKAPSAERLAWFARYLEHANPWLAEDAYLEFGHASFDQVAAVADHLPMADLRRWIADPAVLPEHKGFYGLALGLAVTGADRRENARLLRGLIEKPASDFRAGYDGVLGGYLLLAGEDGLKLVERLLLANRDAADGDVRHAVTALRFYHEFGRKLPPQRLCRAMRLLLARPEFAAAAIVDLARWKDWESLEQVVRLYDLPDFQDAAIKRSILGYLLVATTPEASAELKRLRALDPKGVAEAEKHLSIFGGAR